MSYLVRPKDETEKLGPEQEKILARAVEHIFNVPIRERLFSDVIHLLRGGEAAGRDDLASRFEAWCDTRGWLFNNPIDLWDADRGVFGFDLTAVLDDPEIRTAALGYIFFRIGQMLDGERPMMLFVDEGWKLLGDDKAGAFINDQLKTIRKKNGIVGIGTQSARDITTSRIAHTLLEQSPTNIFFPNPKADRDSYVRGFGLSEIEFEWVKSTSSTSRQFLVKHDHDSVIARLICRHCPSSSRSYPAEPKRWPNVSTCVGAMAMPRKTGLLPSAAGAKSRPCQRSLVHDRSNDEAASTLLHMYGIALSRLFCFSGAG
ncbi:VirB4 family type IV secretion system protein [Rhizobium beringeri]